MSIKRFWSTSRAKALVALGGDSPLLVTRALGSITSAVSLRVRTIGGRAGDPPTGPSCLFDMLKQHISLSTEIGLNYYHHSA